MWRGVLLGFVVFVVASRFVGHPSAQVAAPVPVGMPVELHSDCCLVPANRGLYRGGAGEAMR